MSRKALSSFEVKVVPQLIRFVTLHTQYLVHYEDKYG